MYYAFTCTYCKRLFYTWNRSREQASHILYRSVKKHLVEYDEDRKEYEMDDGEQMDSNQIYSEMVELNDIPSGGYEVT